MQSVIPSFPYIQTLHNNCTYIEHCIYEPAICTHLIFYCILGVLNLGQLRLHHFWGAYILQELATVENAI